MILLNSTFIHVGQLHVDEPPSAISTVLGSCVAVCLYDPKRKIGGMNHYLLPFWNGNGLQTPKFGNIAIPKLIEAMIERGSDPKSLEAKVFGGASMNGDGDRMKVGQKNILVAHEILKEYGIRIVAEDIGGKNGRKIHLDLERGKVLMKYVQRSDINR